MVARKVTTRLRWDNTAVFLPYVTKEDFCSKWRPYSWDIVGRHSETKFGDDEFTPENNENYYISTCTIHYVFRYYTMKILCNYNSNISYKWIYKSNCNTNTGIVTDSKVNHMTITVVMTLFCTVPVSALYVKSSTLYHKELSPNLICEYHNRVYLYTVK